MATTPTRKSIDPDLKQDVVQKIFAKELQFEQALKKHGLQAYQLYAWLGQQALKDVNDPTTASGVHRALTDNAEEQSDMEEDPIPDDLAKQVGRWYLRTHLKG